MPPPAPDGTLRVMFSVRIHGRGGQGVVTAAELLSLALFEARRCLSCGNCFACDNCYGSVPTTP